MIKHRDCVALVGVQVLGLVLVAPVLSQQLQCCLLASPVVVVVVVVAAVVDDDVAAAAAVVQLVVDVALHWLVAVVVAEAADVVAAMAGAAAPRWLEQSGMRCFVQQLTPLEMSVLSQLSGALFVLLFSSVLCSFVSWYLFPAGWYHSCAFHT